VTGGLLAGCASGSGDPHRGTDDHAVRHSARPHGPASPSGGRGTGPVFTPGTSRVPRTAAQGRELADAVALAPQDWGRGFTGRSPARSTPGTWAVLDTGCRWQRRTPPHTVLASTSRYGLLPGGTGKGTVKVTAVATVHTTALDADDQLSTTLEEVLRCPEQEPRSGERITGLMSLGTPFGAREQEYADDSVLEAGEYVGEGGEPRPYRWMLARLGTVVVAASVTGAQGYTQQELDSFGAEALARMLQRVEQRLKEK
jgi:hypothetical protein